jgi:hypothetical protein
MNKFVKNPATKQSLGRRKTVYGIGANDSWYITSPRVNGKLIKCPVYRKWQSMLKRCYDRIYHERNPTYIGCSVCAEWLTFSNYAAWHESNSVDGWDLDKDLKIKGNKIYSPDACIFVPLCINNLLTGRDRDRGAYPKGVSIHKGSGKLQASMSIDGKTRHIGLFNEQELARDAYVNAKNKEIKRKCEQYPGLAKHLINHLES